MSKIITFDSLPSMVMEISEKIDLVLKSLSAKIDNWEETTKYLNMEQTLLYLKKIGYSMSKSRLYKLTARKEIPCHKSDGRVYFTPQRLDEWVSNQIEGRDEVNIDLSSQAIKSVINSIKTKKHG